MYTHTNTHTYSHSHTHTHIHTHTRTYAHLCMYIYLYIGRPAGPFSGSHKRRVRRVGLSRHQRSRGSIYGQIQAIYGQSKAAASACVTSFSISPFFFSFLCQHTHTHSRPPSLPTFPPPPPSSPPLSPHADSSEASVFLRRRQRERDKNKNTRNSHTHHARRFN